MQDREPGEGRNRVLEGGEKSDEMRKERVSLHLVDLVHRRKSNCGSIFLPRRGRIAFDLLWALMTFYLQEMPQDRRCQ
jgi:hypothetical protein